MKTLVMWLDSGDGAGGLSASPAESQHPGEIAAAAALQEHQQKRAKKGKASVEAPIAQRPASAQEKAEPEAKPERDKAKEFEDLIKGDYKDEYSKRMSATIQERVKNIKASEETLSKLTPALEMLYQQKGITPGDVDALVKAITDDDSLYEDEALQRGIPVETLKQIKQLERETDLLKRQSKERAQRELFDRHIQGLVEQSKELQQLYPGFDLRQELQNETFARLTGPNSGISVKQAYYAVHKDEIEAAQAAAIAQRTALDMSRSIQSGSSRPQENGLGSSNPVSLSDNPANWSVQRRKEIAARAKAGESISF